MRSLERGNGGRRVPVMGSRGPPGKRLGVNLHGVPCSRESSWGLGSASSAEGGGNGSGSGSLYGVPPFPESLWGSRSSSSARTPRGGTSRRLFLGVRFVRFPRRPPERESRPRRDSCGKNTDICLPLPPPCSCHGFPSSSARTPSCSPSFFRCLGCPVCPLLSLSWRGSGTPRRRRGHKGRELLGSGGFPLPLTRRRLSVLNNGDPSPPPRNVNNCQHLNRVTR